MPSNTGVPVPFFCYFLFHKVPLYWSVLYSVCVSLFMSTVIVIMSFAGVSATNFLLLPHIVFVFSVLLVFLSLISCHCFMLFLYRAVSVSYFLLLHIVSLYLTASLFFTFCCLSIHSISVVLGFLFPIFLLFLHIFLLQWCHFSAFYRKCWHFSLLFCWFCSTCCCCSVML